MDNILLMMQKGWNVNIECKGINREFSMTFEATASHSEEVYVVHGIGDSIEELGFNLVDNLKMFEHVKDTYQVNN